MAELEQTLSARAQWNAVTSDVPCVRCGRDFVLGVAEASWMDRCLGRIQIRPFRCQVCNVRFRKRRLTSSHARGLGRRQYVRIPSELPALLRFHDETTSTAIVKDLSIAGCEIMGELALERGATLTIQMSGLLFAGTIDVEVAVVHTSRPQTAGLKFIRVRELEREEIGRFLYITWKAGKVRET